MREAFAPLASELAYLDNAAGSFLPRHATDAISAFLSRYGGVNIKQAFALSREVTELKDRARAASATFFNASPQEVVIGPSSTALNFALARALSRRFGPGDEIIVSELEHESNVSPWRGLERQGVQLRIWRARWPEGRLDLADLGAMLSERTRMVALCAAANSVGSTPDVAGAARLARAAGAWTFVDAVHHAPHHLPDVQAWGVDFAVMSPYKVFGPHLGLMYISRQHLAALDSDRLYFLPDDEPVKFEPGTAQHELLAGWLGSLEYLCELGGGGFSRTTLEAAYREIERLEAPVTRRLIEGLCELPQVTLYGEPGLQGRVGTACFNVAGLSPQQVAERLAEQNVAVAAGHYYAMLPMQALGLLPDGAVRASVAHYTRLEDVERLLQVVAGLGAPAVAR
ncbi:cysteine desulfurase family protein (TIGR01976 family) [Deinobacterium chartae]|uniref:Cysteine desulfurase family protein (TIGR01976 family) n=1 Tax=Deinobacterium chartae TaxID=521158 RepID=A0A841I2F7_9DEIO|nr:cysteine desulfurase-like protein [Deinobacterium chartae]MBB6098569.1 cysteine desulfurase family protein (TIGR01976 family) [Deinobacterium chartae]